MRKKGHEFAHETEQVEHPLRRKNGVVAGTQSEQEWIRALKRREAWAWEQLQQLALDRVFGYISLRVTRREDAEDLTAEVFAAAVASIEQFRGEAGVVTWLIAIAQRKIVDAARLRRRRPELLAAELTPEALDASPANGEAPDADTPQAALERRETICQVRRLILRLPEAQRQALWMRCVDQLSLAEIASLLGRTENGVKGLLHRAKSTVLRWLADEEQPPRPRDRSKERHDAGPLLAATLPPSPTAPGGRRIAR